MPRFEGIGPRPRPSRVAPELEGLPLSPRQEHSLARARCFHERGEEGVRFRPTARSQLRPPAGTRSSETKKLLYRLLRESRLVYSRGSRFKRTRCRIIGNCE